MKATIELNKSNPNGNGIFTDGVLYWFRIDDVWFVNSMCNMEDGILSDGWCKARSEPTSLKALKSITFINE